jgi:hypothetical protein
MLMPRTKDLTRIALGSAVVLVLGAAAAHAAPPTGTADRISPARFTTTIDNRYLPLVPGTRMVYRERGADGPGREVVRVTHRTKVVDSVTTVVVRDRAWAGGELMEDTRDWYAQDREGNVWYLGENTTEFERGRPAGTEGSWEAGVNGAQAGIAMPAHPTPGQTFRQEYYRGSAEDNGKVLEVGTPVTVAFGRFTDVVGTEDTNALRKFDVEHKFYARGVGLVLALGVAGDGDREELISFKRGGSR